VSKSFRNLKKIVIDPEAVERLKEIQAWEKPRWFGIRNDLYAKPPGKSIGENNVVGVKDVVRPRVKFNDDPNNE